MTIKEEIKTIIAQRNLLDNKELEKQLGVLVWETKRICMKEARSMLEYYARRKDIHFPIDLFLIKMDNAVK